MSSSGQKFPLYATLLTILGVAVLLTLGTWQVQRLHWKQNLLEELESAYNRPSTTPLNRNSLLNKKFVYGHAEGIFLPQKALLLGPKTQNKKIGYHLITPIQTNKGTLFVNMGWTDAPLDKLPIHHLQNKKIRVEGLARSPSWNSFTPNNQPEKDLWFKPDINEIAHIKELQTPFPYMLYAERTSYKMDAAFPNNEHWEPQNNHLQYALFWYAMAAALIAIFILRFIKRR